MVGIDDLSFGKFLQLTGSTLWKLPSQHFRWKLIQLRLTFSYVKISSGFLYLKYQPCCPSYLLMQQHNSINMKLFLPQLKRCFTIRSGKTWHVKRASQRLLPSSARLDGAMSVICTWGLHSQFFFFFKYSNSQYCHLHKPR